MSTTNTEKAKRRNYKYYVRKAHRYLGILIGIQFAFWTLGGLYFSWSDINQIRGDDVRKKSDVLSDRSDGIRLAFPSAGIDADARITKAEMVSILGRPYFFVGFQLNGDRAESRLIDALDGSTRGAIDESEARRIAVEGLQIPASVVRANYVSEAAAGHEYREKPLPAWAIDLDGGYTVYVAANNGQITAIRNNRWRIYDFLWMLHTQDYGARDNINNWILRSFSALGIVTIASGFALFFISSRTIRRLRLKRR